MLVDWVIEWGAMWAKLDKCIVDKWGDGWR